MFFSQNNDWHFFQVADELVQEFSDPDKHLSPTDQVSLLELQPLNVLKKIKLNK